MSEEKFTPEEKRKLLKAADWEIARMNGQMAAVLLAVGVALFVWISSYFQ